VSGPLLFVLGGTRSGKSRYALARARDAGGSAVTYVATARRGDPELDERIAGHQRERPPGWTTVEAGPDLAAALRAVDPGHVLLLDSLTLWLSLVMDEERPMDDLWAAVERELTGRERPTIVVSDEVGLGIVPMSAIARRFRDDLGILHQRMASRATEVQLMVAGIPMRVKPQ
jgi:adenosylcobinamide kinase / adenosylcobinamide-phosphate guanylyltransferase